MEKQKLNNLLNGDLNLFHEFYEETKMSVFFNIVSIIQNKDQAEDILQETYIKFLENMHKLKVQSNPEGYLFTISRNLSLNFLKKHKRETHFESNDTNQAHFHEENHKNIDFIDKVRALLSVEEFEILFLHSVNEMTHLEISHHIKKPLGTITWMYNNAIKKIQKGLKHYE
jgi:RNA polymerase sigma-70 factor (ECF subfamily)